MCVSVSFDLCALNFPGSLIILSGHEFPQAILPNGDKVLL